jgi:predicted ATPase
VQFLFKVLRVKERPSESVRGVVQLSSGDWDDYSFKTSFGVTLYDLQGKQIDLGSVKIGYIGQTKGWTREKLPETFVSLPEGWFSLGQDVEYYKKAVSHLSAVDRSSILRALRDVVADESALVAAKNERVFKDSLTRGVSMSAIHGQFRRVLDGEVELTDFHFSYIQKGDERYAAVELDFRVEASSKPSTNIHVLIGRNGVGKTTLLNNMAGALLESPRPGQPAHSFYEHGIFESLKPLSKEYFSSIVSVSFSAFDPFLPPEDRPDRTAGPAYFYIGMKNARFGHGADKKLPPKTDADLVNDFVTSFRSCLSQPEKRDRWHNAIKRLESDPNFEAMDLGRLLGLEDKAAIKAAGSMAGKMSSGHSIVLLTITKLVATVEEKTLVLLDEPESHLHPPLLSAFTRALSELLHNRNGVAIIATHSPVVLQEVPRSCVWKLTRFRMEGRSDRPERETFGENVGILTREIFGLEVSKSGFHAMMQHSVEMGGTFDSIVEEYGGQLGAEARAILLSLIAAREPGEGHGL